MQTLAVHSLAALAIYEQRWNALALAAHGSSPMQSYAWVSSYLEHRLQPRERWLCLFVLEGEQLLGVAALVLSPRTMDQLPRSVGGLRYEVLASPRDGHTFAVSWLAAPGREREVVIAIMDGLSRRSRGWLYVTLQLVVEDTAVQQAIRAQGWRLWHNQSPYGVGAYLPTRGDFAAYRKRLSRNFRNNLNKANNKLKRLSGVRFSFHEGAEAEPDDLMHLMAVEAAGWKAREGSAIIQSDELIRFYTTLTERLARAGWLQWHFLRAEDKVLAGNLAVRFGRMILVWKLGYDEAYRKCSPGGLLFERLVERAFASDDIDEVNLSTDQPWYDNWAMAKRSYVDIRLHPHRPRSLLLSYLPQRARTFVRDTPVLTELKQVLRFQR